MYVLITLNVLFIEHESAIKNYMKLPKRKENDRQRMEYNEELYGMRKKFHQVNFYVYILDNI
jgi:hypothetical protein